MGYVKVIQSGKRVETFEYDRYPQGGRPFGKRTAPNPYRKNVGRRRDNALRARENFRRLVAANLGGNVSPAFITLTFAFDVGTKAAFKNLKRFAERLRRTRFPTLRYIAVVEWQKRGRLHFHLLVWGIDEKTIATERKTRNLQRVWLRGYLDARPSDGHPRLATYMAKYLFKAMSDIRYGHQKAYTTSRNVVRPLLWKNDEATQYMELMELSTRPACSNREYMTQFLGRANYKQFDL